MSDDSDEGLKQFDKSFHDLLNDMAQRINPRQSSDFRGLRSDTRKGFLGKIMDFLILLRKGFTQSWRFLVLVQAIFIFLGLAPQVSQSLAVIGINVSGEMLVVLAVLAEVLLLGLGMFMLLYGGSQRSTFLVNQKQNPAQRMDYHFYRAMAKEIMRIKKDLEDLKDDDGS